MSGLQRMYIEFRKKYNDKNTEHEGKLKTVSPL